MKSKNTKMKIIMGLLVFTILFIGTTATKALTTEPTEINDTENFEMFYDNVETMDSNDYYDVDLSEEEWEKYIEQVNSIITEKDWETLSSEQIDEKLRKAGMEVEPADTRDPLYKLTPMEIENLTESEWTEIEKTLIEIYGEDAVETTEEFEIDEISEKMFEEKINSIITEKDWETLSLEQIDEKLRNAGIEIEPADPRDPLYKQTPNEIQNIPDEQWIEINKILTEIYGEDYYDETNQ